MSIIGLMNYNVSREVTGKSQLAEIQSRLLSILEKKSLTKDQLEQIGWFLITDPTMMDQSNIYLGLDQVAIQYKMLQNQVYDASITEHYIR